MGKSLYIRQLAEKSKAISKVVTIPLHGPIVTSDGLLMQLKESVTDSSNAIIHLDIASTVSVILLICASECHGIHIWLLLRCSLKWIHYCSSYWY